MTRTIDSAVTRENIANMEALAKNKLVHSLSNVSIGFDSGADRNHLGNNTKSSPLISAEAALKIRNTRSKRYGLLDTARKILWNEGVKAGQKYPANHHRTIKCMHVRTGSNVGINVSTNYGKAFYTGLAVCGNVWTCPVCSAKIQERRRLEVASAFDYAYENGKKVLMVTFTFPHYSWQKLKSLLDNQSAAFARLRKGKLWDQFREKMGMIGIIRSLEVTIGDNGWHPHTHEAWIVNKDVDAEKLRDYVTNRWFKMCQKEGLVPEGKETDFLTHSVHVMDNCSTSDYLAKQDDSRNWGVDRELVKGSSKASDQKKGIHPFALLELAGKGDKNSSEKYVEYCIAMKSKRQLFWSRGLKDLVGVADKDDVKLANEKDDQALVVTTLTETDWKCIIAHKAKSYILNLAEIEGIDGIRRWLISPEIPINEESKKE